MNEPRTSIPGVTMGVEEEFLLLDARSARPVPRAGDVLADAGALPGRAEGATFQPELHRSQVEAATGRCTTAEALRAQLVDDRRRLATAAAGRDAMLVSAGTPVLDGPPPGITDEARFARIADAYATVMTEYQACGCHVHVAVPDEEAAVGVVNHLRPWLPTLLALTVNSPFHRGRDTGCASWRMVQQLGFPGSGVPPRFDSAAAHRDEVARLVDCGSLVDPEMSFWLARPSPRLPTVELRVADALTTAEEAVFHAVLARAAVRTALLAVTAGVRPPAVRDQVAAAAVWAAARHGIGGSLVDPVREARAPAAVLLRRLLEWIEPALRAAGDAAVVHEGIANLVRRGAGADRQRRAAVGGPRAVAFALARRTAEPSAEHVREESR
ncbi:glutamate--cysteine ligase [Saccharopolyspora sp. 6M]|uniref:carboxylate-amine ligase n=1 Tax=Saccharopolyspora sp. 6M TaxID=2877237 RepID=UPI001CD3A811|nr:glutamate--cysteine ligase [Saccharopolyspora sp. 6M]MCA1225824.1 glutamate--cysteine ligase [Saccharopolyspora sp. 6M]